MLRVLIVDDEPFVRQGICMIIDWRSYGFEITGEAQNGMEALELLKENTYDVIIVDIKMPKMNGIEFIEQVRREISKRVRFIILSGFYEFKYAQQAIRYHVTNYLLKPIQPEELIETLLELKKEFEKQKRIQKLMRSKEKVMIDFYLNTIVAKKNSDMAEFQIKQLLNDKGKYRYIHVEFDSQDEQYGALTIEEKNQVLWEVVSWLQNVYEEGANYIFCNLANGTETCSIGIVATPLFFKKIGLDESTFLKNLRSIIDEVYQYPVKIGEGSEVERITELQDSYEKAANGGPMEGLDPSKILLQQMEKEVKEHYKEELSLKTFSEKYYMNSAYLGQLFKKEYGLFFKDYLNSVRIKNAAKLLIQTNNKIYQIAKEVGYNNTDHFINTFTREMGVTPNKYRKQYNEFLDGIVDKEANEKD